MISQRMIRFACPGLVLVALGLCRADESAPFEHVPNVPFPMTVPRRVPRVIAIGSPAEAPASGVEQTSAKAPLPDPLRGTPAIKPETTGVDALKVLDRLLPGRSDTPYDWNAPVEPLHRPCEPRMLPPCVPPPPCHPSAPPNPRDLVGVSGRPSCGPIYGGPCAPRAGTPHEGPFAWYHRLHDRFFDHFYKWK